MKPAVAAALGEQLQRSRGPGFETTRRILSYGVGDKDLDYLRGGMRSLLPFRSAYDAAEAAGISPQTVASTGRYPGGQFPPIRIEVEHTGQAHLSDGRHRYTVAREYGAKEILADVIQRGPRGGIVVERKGMKVRLR